MFTSLDKECNVTNPLLAGAWWPYLPDREGTLAYRLEREEPLLAGSTLISSMIDTAGRGVMFDCIARTYSETCIPDHEGATESR